MLFFRILWVIDALVAVVAVFFFFIGLGDGTVSSFNIGEWVVLLGVLGGVLGGSIWLRKHGYPIPAILLLCIPALPALLYFLMLVVMMTGDGRWN